MVFKITCNIKSFVSVHIWTCFRSNVMYGNWTRDDKTPDGLFSINTLARTCNVSRATLLRMEQDGLLKPAYVNEDNSYRYYDCKSVAEVIRVINYQQLGFTKKEIAHIYNNPDSVRESLALLREHYEFVLRELEDLNLKIYDEKDIKIRETEISSGYYFRKCSKIIYSPEHVRRMALSGLQDFVSNKMIGTGHKSMLLYVDDENCRGELDHKEHNCTMLIPTQKSDNENVIYQESFKALTLVCQYNYYKSEALFDMLWNEAIHKGLTPVGPVKITGLPEVVFDSVPGGDKNTIRLLLKVK